MNNQTKDKNDKIQNSLELLEISAEKQQDLSESKSQNLKVKPKLIPKFSINPGDLKSEK